MQTTPGTSLNDETARHATPRAHRKLLLWGAVAAVAYAADQGSKWWATHHLTEGVPKQVIGSWMQLRLTHNPGAAFSMGTGYTVVLTLVALAVVAICVKMARQLGSTGWSVAMGLLLGGALGNVTDRLFRAPSPFHGHVVDFLQLPHWPVFNLADSAICVAAVLFVLLTLRGMHLDGSVEGRDKKPAPDGDRPGADEL
ncbi:MAG: signal peptidase II [Nocardioidaceae bacterium]